MKPADQDSHCFSCTHLIHINSVLHFVSSLDWYWCSSHNSKITQMFPLLLTSESMCTKYWLTACSSLPRKKSVVRWTNRPAMTIAVDWDVKQQNTQTNVCLLDWMWQLALLHDIGFFVNQNLFTFIFRHLGPELQCLLKLKQDLS